MIKKGTWSVVVWRHALGGQGLEGTTCTERGVTLGAPEHEFQGLVGSETDGRWLGGEETCRPEFLSQKEEKKPSLDPRGGQGTKERQNSEN